MATRYYAEHQGSDRLPVADGTYFTPIMSRVADNTDGDVSLAFYDDQDNIITPVGGTAKVRGLSQGGQWHQPSNCSEVIDLSECGAEAEYEIPRFNGRMAQGRVVFEGLDVPGATYALVEFWRY